MVLLAFLTAIVIATQYLAILTRPLFPMFSISLVLMPIVIGAALIGVYAGAWLGLVFGFTVLISGDAALFMYWSPLYTVIIVLLKGVLAGAAAGYVYKLIVKAGKIKAAITAAIVCPVVNTGIFIIGAYAFFLPEITAMGMEDGFTSATAYIFLVFVGLNFLVELGINLFLCSPIVSLIHYGKKQQPDENPNL